MQKHVKKKYLIALKNFAPISSIISRLPLFAKGLAFAAVFLTACSTKSPSTRTASEGLLSLPLASTAEPQWDQNITLIQAPLPKPCKFERETVEFCVGPSPLLMSRDRYENLRKNWGERPQNESAAKLRKLLQISKQNWILVLDPETQTPPLVWKDALHPHKIFLWPVEPTVNSIQSFHPSKAPQLQSLSRNLLQIQFPEPKTQYAHRSLLKWNQGTLHILKRTPQRPFRVLIDPGHGGSENGVQVKNLKESELNLWAAQILQSRLEKRGVDAQVTRSSDVNLPLAERFEKFQGADFDLTLSVHHDSIPPQSYQNIEARPACIFGRPEWASLAEKLCAPIAELSNEPAGITQRRLLLTLNPSAPSVLLELMNLGDPGHIEKLSDEKAYKRKLQIWADASAKIILSELERSLNSTDTD